MDLASLQFVSSGISCRVEMPNSIDVVYDVLDQLTLADLLMIDVENHLHLRTRDFIDDLKRFVTAHEVVARMIDQFVEWLDHQHHVSGFKQGSGFSKSVYQRLMLLFARDTRSEISHLRNQDLCSQAFGCVDGFGEPLQVSVPLCRIHQADESGATGRDREVVGLLRRLQDIEVFVPPTPKLNRGNAGTGDRRTGGLKGLTFENGVDADGGNQARVHGLGLATLKPGSPASTGSGEFHAVIAFERRFTTSG